MPLYRYEALDRTGKRVVGSMDVPDDATLSVRLNAMGYRPLVVTPSPGSAPYGRPVSPNVPRVVPEAGGGSKLTASRRSIARMFHQLHVVFRAGMTPFQALLTVAGQTPEPSLRTALTEMARGTQTGQPLSGLMADHPYVFTAGDVGVIRAAEMGGFVPDAIRVLAVQHEEEDNARRRLRIWIWFLQANVYGVFLLIPLLVFLSALSGILRGGTGSPPDVREAILAAVRAFALVSVPLATLYSLALLAFSRYRNSPHWARKWHAMQLRLPVVKRIAHLRANAVFTRILQYLVNAGIPMVPAWEAAARSVPNLMLAERYLAGLNVVTVTHSLSSGMRQIGLLDPSDVGMVATGEASGEVPEALEYLARRYADEARMALGAAVARGAATCVLWSVLLGLMGLAMFWRVYANVAFSAFGLD